MPFLLKSTPEARAHLNETSKKVRERIMAIKGALPKGPMADPVAKLATTVEEVVEDLQTQNHSQWEALGKVDEAAKNSLSGVRDVNRAVETHSIEIKALETAAGELETMATESKADATLAVRLAGSNLSQHQERQLSESQLCVILKGVPQILVEGREKYRSMAAAFERAMGEIKLDRDIQPRLLQRITKRREDKSSRPPHMRVELQSVGHKVLIFEQIRLFKQSNNASPSFSVAPDIPRYALRRHNTLQKISQLCREGNPDLHTRVCIKNKKWPEIQIRNPAGDWVAMPETIFEPARAEFNRRSREASEKKNAARNAHAQSAMDTTSSAPGPSNPRLPTAATPAKTRSGTK